MSSPTMPPIADSGPAGSAEISAISAFRQELDLLVARRQDGAACRDALLACLARHRRLLGGLWHRHEQEVCRPDARRLPDWLLERGDVRHWLSASAARCRAEGRPLLARSQPIRNLTALCLPCPDRTSDRDASRPAAPTFSLTLLVADAPDRSLDAELLAGECVLQAWNNWLDQRDAETAREQLQQTAALLDLESRIAQADQLEEACQRTVQELATLLGCELVAVGLCDARGRSLRVRAISGLSSPAAQAPLVERLESTLLDELQADGPRLYPDVSRGQAPEPLAQRRLAEALGVEAVGTLPLRDTAGQLVGGLLAGGAARTLLTPRTRSLLSALSEPVGTALGAVGRRTRGPLARLGQRWREASATRRGIVTLACCAGVLAALFVPLPYRVRCRVHVEPQLRRYALAPHAGLVEQTWAAPGELVSQGQVVARLDGRQARLELAEVTAERERKSKLRDVHLSARRVADALLAGLEVEQLDARRHLLLHRLDQLEIRSPIDGIVLSGSVDQRQHLPVEQGQVLYEIAPLQTVRLELAIPADELPHVERGQTVDIRINGEAGYVRSGIISQVRPQSEIRDGLNVFIGEVEMENRDLVLRPGMEGAARVQGPRHPLGWILGHRLWERLATLVWW
ncbi:MAG: HlyD family efflux transporter periplasmic adaptor subunit [Pirellulales bacterium]